MGASKSVIDEDKINEILKEINYTVLKIIKQKIKEANKNPNEEYKKGEYFLKV